MGGKEKELSGAAHRAYERAQESRDELVGTANRVNRYLTDYNSRKKEWLTKKEEKNKEAQRSRPQWQLPQSKRSEQAQQQPKQPEQQGIATVSDVITFCQEYKCGRGTTIANCYHQEARKVHPDKQGGNNDDAFKKLHANFEKVEKHRTEQCP